LDVVENINHLLGDGQANTASKGAFKETRLTVFPMFGTGYDLDVSTGEGGHGGADPVMLEQVFSPNAPPDPFNRAASHLAGAASILMGIAGNEAMRTKRLIVVDEMFPLSEKMARLNNTNELV
jgi:hypothetical protein